MIEKRFFQLVIYLKISWQKEKKVMLVWNKPSARDAHRASSDLAKWLNSSIETMPSLKLA